MHVLPAGSCVRPQRVPVQLCQVEESDVFPKGASARHQDRHVHVRGPPPRHPLRPPAQRLLANRIGRGVCRSDQRIDSALDRLHPEGVVDEIRQPVGEDADGHPEHDHLHHRHLRDYCRVHQNCRLHLPELRCSGHFLSI